MLKPGDRVLVRFKDQWGDPVLVPCIILRRSISVPNDWCIEVDPDDVDPRIITGRLWVSESRLVIPPQTILCPECDEEDFFLEDDYVCAACRFAIWEDQDARMQA